MSYRDRLGVLPMYALPHHLLSSLMLSATRIRLPAWKNWQIRWFIRRYGVDMSIAQESAPGRVSRVQQLLYACAQARGKAVVHRILELGVPG